MTDAEWAADIYNPYKYYGDFNDDYNYPLTLDDLIDENKPILFLSGHIGDYITPNVFEETRRKFALSQELLMSAGYAVWNPLVENPNPKTRHEAIKGDLIGILSKCTGICLTCIGREERKPGNGRKLEKDVGKACGLKVHTLQYWLDKAGMPSSAHIRNLLKYGTSYI
jgi:hypothetical protein